MLRSKVNVYLHLIWTTWQRQPLISESMEAGLYACIISEASKLKCEVLAVNGMPDHVHVVVKLSSVSNISGLVKQMKGVSSTLARNLLSETGFFGWQDRYAAFSVSPWDVKKVVRYVQNQKEHHAKNSLLAALETSDG